jgi:inositol hexakisphosphate/diphosphoinositol-pentakisphosphate kinase
MSRSNSVGREGGREGVGEGGGRKLEPHGGETLLLMLDRWKKLHKDLFNSKTDTFDLSKVPDVHDNIR